MNKKALIQAFKKFSFFSYNEGYSIAFLTGNWTKLKHLKLVPQRDGAGVIGRSPPLRNSNPADTKGPPLVIF